MAIIIINNVRKNRGIDFSNTYIEKFFIKNGSDYSHSKFTNDSISNLDEAISVEPGVILDFCNFEGVHFRIPNGANRIFIEEGGVFFRGANLKNCIFGDWADTKRKFIEWMGSGSYENGLQYVSAETIWIDGTSILEP